MNADFEEDSPATRPEPPTGTAGGEGGSSMWCDFGLTGGAAAQQQPAGQKRGSRAAHNLFGKPCPPAEAAPAPAAAAVTPPPVAAGWEIPSRPDEWDMHPSFPRVSSPASPPTMGAALSPPSSPPGPAAEPVPSPPSSPAAGYHDLEPDQNPVTAGYMALGDGVPVTRHTEPWMGGATVNRIGQGAFGYGYGGSVPYQHPRQPQSEPAPDLRRAVDKFCELCHQGLLAAEGHRFSSAKSLYMSANSAAQQLDVRLRRTPFPGSIQDESKYTLNRVDAMRGLCTACLELGHLDQAEHGLGELERLVQWYMTDHDVTRLEIGEQLDQTRIWIYYARGILYNKMADEFGSTGRGPEAVDEQRRRAAEMFEEAAGRYSGDLRTGIWAAVAARLQQASTLQAIGCQEDELEALLRARQVLEMMAEQLRRGQVYADVLLRLAECYDSGGDRDSALETWGQAAALARDTEHQPTQLIALSCLTNAYVVCGRYDQADAARREMAKIRRGVLEKRERATRILGTSGAAAQAQSAPADDWLCQNCKKRVPIKEMRILPCLHAFHDCCLRISRPKFFDSSGRQHRLFFPGMTCPHCRRGLKPGPQ
eukprot:TRINITY_DN922_c0_g2_i2.p1 TRINITY_DN922_c0_g2~~TRINITY_DN922_c0_g2_i2.p1  ORF type:complete len:594 (+),score=122.75 TRINITY_DN922_c0_g2_i2:87-1868(+)